MHTNHTFHTIQIYSIKYLSISTTEVESSVNVLSVQALFYFIFHFYLEMPKTVKIFVEWPRFGEKIAF